MNGVQLTFFTLQNRRHGDRPIVEWLTDAARSAGIAGVTVLPAQQGYGHEGAIHSASFFDLADRPLVLVMIASPEACEALMTQLEREKPGVFYTKAAIEYGVF